jgi:hypothetical protein
MPNGIVVNMSALLMGLFAIPAPQVYVLLLRRAMYRWRTKNTKRPRRVTAETTTMPAMVPVERRNVRKVVDTDSVVGLAADVVGIVAGGVEYTTEVEDDGTTGKSSEVEVGEGEDWVSLVVVEA